MKLNMPVWCRAHFDSSECEWRCCNCLIVVKRIEVFFWGLWESWKNGLVRISLNYFSRGSWVTDCIIFGSLWLMMIFGISSYGFLLLSLESFWGSFCRIIVLNFYSSTMLVEIAIKLLFIKPVKTDYPVKSFTSIAIIIKNDFWSKTSSKPYFKNHIINNNSWSKTLLRQHFLTLKLLFPSSSLIPLLKISV